MVRVTVPSFAKLNLDLRVLGLRPDGYHELRTIFQTISLHDSLTIEFESAKRTQIDLSCSIDIPDNLVVRSAKTVLEHLNVRAWVRFAVNKRIPTRRRSGRRVQQCRRRSHRASSPRRKADPLTRFASFGRIAGQRRSLLSLWRYGPRPRARDRALSSPQPAPAFRAGRRHRHPRFYR